MKVGLFVVGGAYLYVVLELLMHTFGVSHSHGINGGHSHGHGHGDHHEGKNAHKSDKIPKMKEAAKKGQNTKVVV